MKPIPKLSLRQTRTLSEAADRARPLWQRQFLRLLMQEMANGLPACVLTGRSDKGLHLSFPWLADQARKTLSVWVGQDTIAVSVVHAGHNYDRLFWPDAYPERLANGEYTDPQLLPEYRRNWDSLFALRNDLLYQDLFNWIRQKLVPARWLEICWKDYGGEMGGSYAHLTQSKPEPDTSTHRERKFLEGLTRVDGTKAPPCVWRSLVLPLRADAQTPNGHQ